MDSQIREVDEITREISITVPVETVQERYNKALGQVSQNSKIKGFRPGSAPKNLVEKTHGPRVRMEVARQLISESLSEVIQKNELPMVGDPDIEFEDFDPSVALEFKASISLYPSPTISLSDSYAVEVEKPEVEQKDIDEVMQRLRDSKAKVEKLQFRTTSQAGDVLEGAIAVSEAGEADVKPEPVTIPLGQGMLPDDVEAAYVGMEIGETKSIESTAPVDHPNEALRGKTLTYRFELQGLSERVLPEEDDEFAKSVGLEAETLLELRVKVRERLETEVEADAKAAAQSKVLEQISEQNEFLIPQALIDNEIRSLLVRQGFVDPNKMNVNQLSVEPFRDSLGEVAEKRVRTAIVVDAVSEQQSLTASEEDIDQAIKTMAEANGMEEDQVRQFLSQPNQKESFAREQTRTKVLDSLLERAEVTYVAPKNEEPSEEKSSE